jgi:hypothetical protein
MGVMGGSKATLTPKEIYVQLKNDELALKHGDLGKQLVSTLDGIKPLKDLYEEYWHGDLQNVESNGILAMDRGRQVALDAVKDGVVDIDAFVTGLMALILDYKPVQNTIFVLTALNALADPTIVPGASTEVAAQAAHRFGDELAKKSISHVGLRGLEAIRDVAAQGGLEANGTVLLVLEDEAANHNVHEVEVNWSLVGGNGTKLAERSESIVVSGEVEQQVVQEVGERLADVSLGGNGVYGLCSPGEEQSEFYIGESALEEPGYFIWNRFPDKGLAFVRGLSDGKPASVEVPEESDFIGMFDFDRGNSTIVEKADIVENATSVLDDGAKNNAILHERGHATYDSEVANLAWDDPLLVNFVLELEEAGIGVPRGTGWDGALILEAAFQLRKTMDPPYPFPNEQSGTSAKEWFATMSEIFQAQDVSELVIEGVNAYWLFVQDPGLFAMFSWLYPSPPDELLEPESVVKIGSLSRDPAVLAKDPVVFSKLNKETDRKFEEQVRFRHKPLGPGPGECQAADGTQQGEGP